LERLAVAIEQRVGAQRFHVWFHNSTRLDLRGDGLEIAVPNDFISEWIVRHFARSIQEAAQEVMGGPLPVRFCVMPQLFELENDKGQAAAVGTAVDECRNGHRAGGNGKPNNGRNGNGQVNGNGHRNGNGSGESQPAKGTGTIGGAAGAAGAAAPDSRVAGANGRAAGEEAPNLGDVSLTARMVNGANAVGAASAAAGLNGASSANGNGHHHNATNGHAKNGVGTTTSNGHNGNGHNGNGHNGNGHNGNGRTGSSGILVTTGPSAQPLAMRSRLRHDLDSFVVGPGNQLAYNSAGYVAQFPGGQYNPLFIHGDCGLGKTHLLQGLCKKFIENHPARRWMYLTGEDFTNEFLIALRGNKMDNFRRKVRELDLLVIDDVHFLGGKKATQEEFLHTFNAIEAMGRQVVMASDSHPKMIEEFGESLINRFLSGMVVRIDPPNYATRCEMLRAMSNRAKLGLSEEVIAWIARRVTQNVRELEGAITRIDAQVRLTGRSPDVTMAQDALGDLDRQHGAPVRPENVLLSVCEYFGLEQKDLMSGRRQRTISLARSVAMYLVRKTAKLSFPEIGTRMGKRNHSTVISACRRIEKAVHLNESLIWTSAVGERTEEATELVQRLEEHSRALG
jgi:chromosomal replication initiator protein